MRLETAEFIVTGCAWPCGARASLKSDRQPDDMKSVSLTYRSCSSSWIAMKGEGFGKFRTGTAALSITCPNGETHGHIAPDLIW